MPVRGLDPAVLLLLTVPDLTSVHSTEQPLRPNRPRAVLLLQVQMVAAPTMGPAEDGYGRGPVACLCDVSVSRTARPAARLVVETPTPCAVLVTDLGAICHFAPVVEAEETAVDARLEAVWL